MSNLDKFFDDFDLDKCVFDFTIKDNTIRQPFSVTHNCDYDSLRVHNILDESYIMEYTMENKLLAPYFSFIEDFINKEVLFLGDKPEIDPNIIHNNFRELKFSDSSMSVYFSCFNIDTKNLQKFIFFKVCLEYIL